MLLSSQHVYYSCRTHPVIPQEISIGSPRRFRSCQDDRGPAQRETAGFTPCAPRLTYPRRNPGPKRPSEFPARRVPILVQSNLRPTFYNLQQRWRRRRRLHRSAVFQIHVQICKYYATVFGREVTPLFFYIFPRLSKYSPFFELLCLYAVDFCNKYCSSKICSDSSYDIGSNTYWPRRSRRYRRRGPFLRPA